MEILNVMAIVELLEPLVFVYSKEVLKAFYLLLIYLLEIVEIVLIVKIHPILDYREEEVMEV
jgi:hypothetical protein